MALPALLASLRKPATLSEPLAIVQGATFYRAFTLLNGVSPIDISGMTISGRVSQCYLPKTGYKLADFTADLVTDGTDGALYISLTAEETGALTAPEGAIQPVDLGVFEVDISDGEEEDAEVATILRGKVVLYAEPATETET